MNFYKIAASTLVVSVALVYIVAPTQAGLFDDPKNLKVLPKDISPAELSATMRGFAINTGSRCSSCHVGEEEKDLSTYDFSLDDKEKKRKARMMLKMVQDINHNLAEKLGKPADELVKVDCATCHRGQAKPEMLQDVLATAYRSDGLDIAIENYRALRERYYGGYTFDFSARPLMVLAERLAKEDETAAALGFVNLNLEFYPESVQTHVLLAKILSATGDKPAARRSLQKALKIEPENQWLKKMLARLDADNAPE